MEREQPTYKFEILLVTALAFCFPNIAQSKVEPMLSTQWGQAGLWQQNTPLRNGFYTYPGCTTIAAAQILYYYKYQNQASSPVSYTLEYDGIIGPDVHDGVISLNLTEYSYDWQEIAETEEDSPERIANAAEFIYHVGLTLNAQFGGGEGSSATGKQIENAFRYQWGYNNKSRRTMSIISKSAFLYSDSEWAQLIQNELDAGRPVLYMALQVEKNAGHAFVIDGYREDGKVHVNWGWGGLYNGYYELETLEDHKGRRWSREPMIFRALEPEPGYAKPETVQ